MMTDLLLEVLSHYGLTEVSGSQSNPDIIDMGKELGIDIIDDSTFSWCSISYATTPRNLVTTSLTLLLHGLGLKMPIVVLKPSMGDVVVLWRESKFRMEGPCWPLHQLG